MYKNSVKLITSIILILSVIMINIASFAVDNTLTLKLEADKTEIKKGETVTILVKATNIQGNGIVTFNANVIYDTNIFTCTAHGDDAGIWEKQGFIENNLTTTRVDLLANKEDQVIAKLVFKAKTDAEIGKQTITLKQIEFSTGDVTFNTLDTSKEISIISEVPPEDNPNQNTNTNTNTGINNNSNNNNGNSNIVINKSNSQIAANSNLATKSLPYAGYYSILAIGIVIMIIIAGVSYYKYKRTC